MHISGDLFLPWAVTFFAREARENFLTAQGKLPPRLFWHSTWGGKEFTWSGELRQEDN